MKNYNEIYAELQELLGEETMIKLYKRFKGQQISFPARLYNPKYVAKQITMEYNGDNIGMLAIKYNYTEKTVRRMLKKYNEDHQ